MGRVAVWLAFGIAGTLFAVPAEAAWTGKQFDDGHGHRFFLASATADNTRAEIFCSPEGVVNFSLAWPDRKHRDAADVGAPVDMRIETDADTRFEAMSYYWASGKGQLILDFGNPAAVRDIVEALKAPGAELTVSVDDSANGIEKTVTFDAAGAEQTAIDYLAWCPAAIE